VDFDAAGTADVVLQNYGSSGTVAGGTIAGMTGGTTTVWAQQVPQSLAVTAANAFVDEGEVIYLKKPEAAPQRAERRLAVAQERPRPAPARRSRPKASSILVAAVGRPASARRAHSSRVSFCSRSFVGAAHAPETTPRERRGSKNERAERPRAGRCSRRAAAA
jgi:hypothetical protein